MTDRQEIEQILLNTDPNPEIRALTKLCIQRIFTGGASFGSLSWKAHETIARAMNLLALIIHDVDSADLLRPGQLPYSNSGEGGEDKERNIGGAKSDARSRGRQFASSRFGVDAAYLSFADFLEIKVSQAVKPGTQGDLPGPKNTPKVASLRNVPPYTRLLSLANPPDQASIEDHHVIHHNLASANEEAQRGVKLTASEDVPIVAVGAAKAGAQRILIGGPGSTGAAPTTARHYFAGNWELAIPKTWQFLEMTGWNESVELIASGGIQTGEDCFKAGLLGAKGVEILTPILVAMGCNMQLECHLNTCEQGLTTTNEELIEKFTGTPVQVARYVIELATSWARLLAQYGFKDPAEAIRRTDLVEVSPDAPLQNLENLLYNPENLTKKFNLPKKPPLKGSSPEELDIIEAIQKGERIFNIKGRNGMLSFGARIHNKIFRDPTFPKFTAQDPVTITFNGMAVGGSFGFVAPPHLTLYASISNDGTAKSNDGSNVYIARAMGNFTGFGSIRGDVFGPASGDRYITRFSGGRGVVETIGDGGANFVTGGQAVILGDPNYYTVLKDKAFSYTPPTRFREEVAGCNFGSGMTAGKIYLPKLLYTHLKNRGHLSSDVLAIKAKPITRDSDKQALDQLLETYIKEIKREWVTEVRKAENYYDDFIQLKPPSSAIRKSTAYKPPAALLSTETPQSHQTAEPSVVQPLSAFTRATTPHDRSHDPVPSYLQTPVDKNDCGVGLFLDRSLKSTQATVKTVLAMLARFQHRGTTGVDVETGDGCGIVWYGLDHFFQKKFPQFNLISGNYCIAPIFLPGDDAAVEQNKALFNHFLKKLGLEIAEKGCRKVPTNRTLLGAIGKTLEPDLYQLLILKPETLSQQEFEKALALARLQFELTVKMQPKETPQSPRSHVCSASSYYIIDKSFVLEDRFGDYKLDYQDPAFTVFAGIVHTRFATNTWPSIENIQPCPRFSNNGENNALALLIEFLTNNPEFKKWVAVHEINLSGLSDSHIMSIYMEYLYASGYTLDKIVASTTHPYRPLGDLSSTYYNLFAIPFEGPNASIVTLENKIQLIRDRNGFRPLVGWLNEQSFYAGSEWGPVEPESSYDLFYVPAGRPIEIDLKNNHIDLFRTDVQTARFHAKQIGHLSTLQVAINPEELTFTPEEYQLLKRQAGWDDEFDRYVMQPLYTKSSTVQSMGNQGPVEALVKGTHQSLRSYFRGKFAQITNPPHSKVQEGCYLTSLTFIGPVRPKLAELGKKLADGNLLLSPTVNNSEMTVIRKMHFFKSRVLPLFIDCSNGVPSVADFYATVESMKKTCIEAVEKEGVSLLILSDLKKLNNMMPLYDILICSIIDKALKTANLRSSVTLVLHSSRILCGTDIALAVSVGGVDYINPYLACAMKSPKEVEHFQEGIRQELFSFMACPGVVSVTAYRGAKQFTGYFDEELSALFGISSASGGLSLKGLLQISYDQNYFPSTKNLGRFDIAQAEGERTPIWNPEVTRHATRSARATNPQESRRLFAQMETHARKLREGLPRGLLTLKTPHSWTETNPMPIAIIGGGAAGFYQARTLLESGMPIMITIFEERYVNKFGLLGDGIAPDHAATKKSQAALLEDVLHDKRVRYCGGMKIGVAEKITPSMLKKSFACVIDCSGARQDKTLGIPGESQDIGVIPASKVYKSYNDEFNPNQEHQYPLNTQSKSNTVIIIGSGNVAADLARMLLQDPAKLKNTAVSPIFLEGLKSTAPHVVRIFARGRPVDSKISLKELEALAHLDNISISATFSTVSVESIKTEEQKQLMAFFNRYHLRSRHRPGDKQLHFHFEQTPTQFIADGKEVQVIFRDSSGSEKTYMAKNCITAIGVTAMTSIECHYRSGWATGVGGTLSHAEESAQSVTDAIKVDFDAQKFPCTVKEKMEWLFACPLNNQGQLNMLAYLAAGNRITDEISFHQAKNGQAEISPSDMRQQAVQALTLLTIVPGQLTIYDKNNTPHRVYLREEDADTNLMVLLLRFGIMAMMPHECGGKKTCGTCVVEFNSSNSVSITDREIRLMKANGLFAPRRVLSCWHKVGEFINIEDSSTGCSFRLVGP